MAEHRGLPGTQFDLTDRVGVGETAPVTASGLVSAGQWYHFAAVVNSISGKLQVYLNGRLAVQAPYSTNGIRRTTGPLTFGASGGGKFFCGQIDEIALFSRALTTNEIAAIYGAGIAGKCTDQQPPHVVIQPEPETVAQGGTATFSVVATGTEPFSYQWRRDGVNLEGQTNATLTLLNVQPADSGSFDVVVSNALGSATSSAAALAVDVCVTPPAGLVSWWRAENNALDQVGTNQGTSLNGTTFAAGKVGQAFSFNGSGAYVGITTTGSLGGAFTVEFWVMPLSSTATLGLVGSRTPSDSSFDIKLMYGTRIHSDIGDGNSWITTTADAPLAYTVGSWYHIACAVSPTNYSIYVNGALAAVEPTARRPHCCLTPATL